MNKKNKKGKKLILSAETVRNLNEPQLQHVAGGVSLTRVCCTATHACSGCQPCA